MPSIAPGFTRHARLSLIMVPVLLVLAVTSCQTTPEYHPEERTASYTLVGNPGTRVRDSADRQLQDKADDLNGLYLLQEGLAAFKARTALIDFADVSLDLQYYIFANDTSGRIILAKLLAAADRGVRVRLLVDDMGTPVQAPWVATLALHPNISIRIFNPVASRSGLSRQFQQAWYFNRVNHRMHNKLLSADGLAIITGGRNIGDAYFSNDATFFQDVDIFAFGPVVKSATASFDDYWNHPAAVPIHLLFPDSRGSVALDELRQNANELLADVESSQFNRALANTDLARRLQSKTLELEWGRARLYADPPDKTTRRDAVNREDYLVNKLMKVLRTTRERLHISSAYFIPGEEGVAFLDSLVQRGVEVSVLTNALSTTDVAVVHSGYSQYRKPLIEAGVKLWELRLQAGRKQHLQWFAGESNASLHAKSFVIDDDRAIIGSVNLDGRSLLQNTEIGMYVESRAINDQLESTFQAWTHPNYAWQLSLDKDEDLLWNAENDQGQAVVEHHDPESTGWQRFKIWLLSLLPIEQQI